MFVSSIVQLAVSTTTLYLTIVALLSCQSNVHGFRPPMPTSTLLLNQIHIQNKVTQITTKSNYITHTFTTPSPLFSSIDANSNDANSIDANSIDSKKSSMTSSTFNVIKACVGAGVLSLPAGVSAFSSNPTALYPSITLMLFLGILSGYSFNTIGKICKMSGSKSISEAWEKTVSDNSLPISLACFLTPLGAALSYSIILADTFSSLSTAVGSPVSRSKSIIVLSATILYRLCRMKDLSSLAPVSIVGVGGILVTCFFMAMRAVGDAYKIGGGMYGLLSAAGRPVFDGGVVKFFDLKALVLVSMAATAYLSHFNAPDFLNDLEDNTEERFKKLVTRGFGITAVISAAMMSFGFLTFGGACQGVVLNNYADFDKGATLCRGLMALSVIGSYPFVFSGMKNGFFSLVGKKEVSPRADKTFVRVGLTVITGLALVLKNAGFISAFMGAVCGSAIIYIFPSVMFLKYVKDAGRRETADRKSVV